MMLAFLASGSALNARVPKLPTTFQLTKVPASNSVFFTSSFSTTYDKGTGSTTASMQYQTCSTVTGTQTCNALSNSVLISGNPFEQNWNVQSVDTSLTWTGKIKVTNNLGYVATYSVSG